MAVPASYNDLVTEAAGRDHKGVFTRDRQPKAAAWLLRDLWRPGPAS
jgi:hypothetical protein